MAKIHDWSRVYWRNASGEREYFMEDDLDEDSVADETRCIYRNEEGDEVAYRVADPEAEHGQKYEVTFNGEVVEGVSFPEGSRWLKEDTEREADVELAAFGTRADAREFSAAWREDFGSPDALGYVTYDEDELLEMDYDEVVDVAQDIGIRGNQSHEDLAAQIAGEEDRQLTNGAAERAVQ